MADGEDEEHMRYDVQVVDNVLCINECRVHQLHHADQRDDESNPLKPCRNFLTELVSKS